MHSKNIPLFFIVASLTSSSLGLHHLVVTARRSLGIIMARQTDPGPCSSICSSADSTVTACTTTSCLCTSAIATSIQACVNCAVGADPTVSVVSSAQSLIDTFETTCASVAGVPSVTINTNPGTPQSTPAAIVPSQSTIIIPATTVSQIVIGPSSTTSPSTQSTIIIPATTVSQIVIGPSSTSPSTQVATSTSVGSTSTASSGGLPLKSSASLIILHWIGALIGLATWNLLVF